MALSDGNIFPRAFADELLNGPHRILSGPFEVQHQALDGFSIQIRTEKSRKIKLRILPMFTAQEKGEKMVWYSLICVIDSETSSRVISSLETVAMASNLSSVGSSSNLGWSSHVLIDKMMRFAHSVLRGHSSSDLSL
jgi:hypothetical protein